MAKRNEVAAILDAIQEELLVIQREVGRISAHLHEGGKDDFSDMHSLDREIVVIKTDSVKRRLEVAKINLDHATSFLRRE